MCVPNFRDGRDGHGNSNLPKVRDHGKFNLPKVRDHEDCITKTRRIPRLVSRALVSLQLRRMLVGRDDHNFMHAVGFI